MFEVWMWLMAAFRDPEVRAHLIVMGLIYWLVIMGIINGLDPNWWCSPDVPC